MGKLARLQEIDQFCEVIKVPEAAVTPEVLGNVRQLNERHELEPMLREILWDPTETPHGPTEIADILTTKVRLRGELTLAAFVVKGKSFKQVRSSDIAHQLLRLRQLPGLGLMVIVAVGHIQDDARRDFLQVAMDIGCDHLTIDAVDCARLLLAYEKICPVDGTPYGPEGSCLRGHKQDKGVELKIRVREGLQYEIPSLRDVSHGGARRLSATLLVNPSYDREVLREIIKDVTQQVRHSTYHRSDLVAKRWGGTDAHVVWLYLAGNLQDLSNANWLARTQWIASDLGQKMRPLALSASEYQDSIAIAWNESYDEMRRFYGEHSVDKGEALSRLKPLIDRASTVGTEIASWFDAYVSGDFDESKLISQIVEVSGQIEDITDAAADLPFPPEDVKDYDARAQSVFAHLGNMALYYSSRGLELWPQENRTRLMRATVEDFRKDLERLKFEAEKMP